MLNKILTKLIVYKDRIFIDLLTKLWIKNKKEIKIKNGRFNQKTIFYMSFHSEKEREEGEIVKASKSVQEGRYLHAS
ncbi:MAG: hypothetical protein ACRC4Y_08360 [Cetobacterium sp.]